MAVFLVLLYNLSTQVTIRLVLFVGEPKDRNPFIKISLELSPI
jgi:hypothetical protein